MRVNEVCVNGSFHLHGVGSEKGAVKYEEEIEGGEEGGEGRGDREGGRRREGGRIRGGGEKIEFTTLDAAIVTPGFPTPFPTPLSPPDLSFGVHFHLWNNIWGTNYVMWFPFLPSEPSLLYRFAIHL